MVTKISICYILDEEDKKSIKKQMVDLELTYRKLAKLLNISTAYICDILNGNRNLTVELKGKFEKQGIKFKENDNETDSDR